MIIFYASGQLAIAIQDRNLLDYYLNQLDQDLDFKRKLLRSSLLLLLNVESERGYGYITDFIEEHYKILISQSDESFKEKVFKDLISITQAKHIDYYSQDISEMIFSNFDGAAFKKEKLAYLKTQDDTFNLIKYIETLIFYDEPKVKIDLFYQKKHDVQDITVAYIKYLINKKYFDEALSLLYEKVSTYE